MSKVRYKIRRSGLAFIILYLTNLLLISSIYAATFRGGLNAGNLGDAVASLIQEPVILLGVLFITWIMFLIAFTDDGYLLVPLLWWGSR